MAFKSLAIVFLVALMPLTAAVAGTPVTGTSLQGIFTGRVEVPKGDPDGRGTVKVTILGAKVCWDISTTKVGPLTAAHIHKGGVGKAGPVVVAFGSAYKAKGCVRTTASTAEAIKGAPKEYYVNVHDAKYPSGALRAQLVPADEAMH